MKASATIYFISSLSARQVRYKAYRPESPQERESRPKDYSITDSCCWIEGAEKSFLQASSLSIFLGCMPKAINVFCRLRWIDLRYRASSLYQLMLRQCLIWVCSCPRQLRGSHRSITEVSTTELAYAPLWSSAISIKKDWVGKTWIGLHTRPTSFQSKSQSKTSSTRAGIWKRRFTFRNSNSKWHDSFRS